MKRCLLLAVAAAGCTVPHVDVTGKTCGPSESCPDGLTCVRAIGAATGRCGAPEDCDALIPTCGTTQRLCEPVLVEAPVADFHWRYVDGGYSAVWTRGDHVAYRRWNTQLEPETAELSLAGGAHWPWLAVSDGALVVSWVEGQGEVQSLHWARLALSGEVLGPSGLLATINTTQAPRAAWNSELELAGIAWLDPSVDKVFAVAAQLDGGVTAPKRLYASGRRVDAFDFAENFTLSDITAGWVDGVSGIDPTRGDRQGVDFFWFDGGFEERISAVDVFDAGLPAIVFVPVHNHQWLIWATDRGAAGRTSVNGAAPFELFDLDGGAPVIGTAAFAGPPVPSSNPPIVPLLFSFVQQDGAATVWHGLAQNATDQDPNPLGQEWAFSSLPTWPPEVAMGPKLWAAAYPADSGYGGVVRVGVHCAP